MDEFLVVRTPSTYKLERSWLAIQNMSETYDLIVNDTPGCRRAIILEM